MKVKQGFVTCSTTSNKIKCGYIYLVFFSLLNYNNGKIMFDWNARDVA